MAESKSEIASRLRLNEQVALMLNIDKLLIKKPSNDPTDNCERILTNYNNFTVFRGVRGTTDGKFDSKSSGGHIDLTRHLFRNDDIKRLLKNMPNNILSSLQPSIKIYKIFYPNENGTGYSWRIPFDDISVDYLDRTSLFQKSFDAFDPTTATATTANELRDSQQSSIDELLAGNGKLHGVGIKSFSYKYVGTNPAEVHTNIEAELQIYFQDIRDLVKEIPIEATDPNFTEGGVSFPWPLASFSYTDLVADVARRESVKGIEQANSRYYRIKIVVGYAEPSMAYLSALVGEEKAIEYLNSIRSAKVMMYLNPHNHDVTFEENGTATITIKYIAAMTSVLADINALAIDTDSLKIQKLSKDLQDIRSNLEYEKQRISNDCDTTRSDEGKDKEIKAKEKEKRKELYEAETKLDNQRNKVYSEVFRRLIGDKDNKIKGRIFSAKFNKYALGIIPKPFSMDSDVANPEEATKQRNDNLEKSRIMEDYSISSITPEDKSWLRLANPAEEKPVPTTFLSKIGGIFGLGEPEIDTESKDTAANAITADADKNQKTDPSASEDSENLYEVKFVFLGDIFDIFCDSLEQVENPNERPKIILTEFNIDIPKVSQFNNPESEAYKRNDVYETVTVNIADIPISLNMLQNFFIEKIVRPRRDTYPLLSLLYDLLTEVVSPSISPSVFGRKTVLNKMIRMSSITLAIPYIFDGESFKDVFTAEEFDKKFSGTITDEILAGSAIASSLTRNEYSPFGNYVIFYCSNQFPNIIRQNNGDFEIDENMGIYHYSVGSDTSLVKKISFSRTNTPFYKEAKAQSSGGSKSLGRLREVYDCSIVMFGNNVYRPGDYLFIEPMFFRGTSAVVLENKIGLGGYYQIIDVTTKINDNIYETTLSAVLYGHIEQYTDQEGKLTKHVVADDSSRGRC